MVHVRLARLLAVGCLLAALAPAPVEASGVDTLRWAVDFTSPAEAGDAVRWTWPDRVRCTPSGLGADGRADAIHEVTIRSTCPMALGHPWWAATNAIVVARARWSTETASRASGQLYVRHAPDAVHWSAWQQVPQAQGQGQADGSPHESSYRTDLGVPRERVEAWRALCERVRAEDPSMRPGDLTAAAREIESLHPGWMARTTPFFGYLEFRYDATLTGRTRLLRLEIDVTTVVPGPVHPPREEGVDPRVQYARRWAYRQDEQALLPGTPAREAAAREVVRAALLRDLRPGDNAGLGGREKAVHAMFMHRTAPCLDLYDVVADALGPGEVSFPSAAGVTLRHGLAEDLRRRNQESRIAPQVELGTLALESVGREGAMHLLRGGPERRRPGSTWEGFHARHPGSLGLLWVSEPGFSDDGTQAVVHVNRMWRDLAGHGALYLLEKREGTWVVVASETIWVS